MDRRHPQLRFIIAQRVRETPQRELACRIRRQPGRGVDACAGVDEHHLTAGAAQGRQKCERKRHRPNDIDFHGGAPLVDRRLGDASGERRARVVDQHVELDDRLDGRRYVVGVLEIQRPCSGTQPLGHRVEPIGRPSAEKQRVSGLKCVGDRRSEPTRRSGDERGRHAGHPTDWDH